MTALPACVFMAAAAVLAVVHGKNSERPNFAAEILAFL
jgi:hypothetical protein